MLEMFKLRLRDGTVLVVDHGALSTWLVDGKAMVQPVGSERWLPLRQFLAREKAEAAAAARRNPMPEEGPAARQPPLEIETRLPLVPPPVKAPPLPVSKPAVPASAPPVWTSPPPVFGSESSVESEPSVSVHEPPIAVNEPPEVWAPTEEADAPATQLSPPDEVISLAALPSTDEPEVPRFADAPSPSDPPAPLLSDSEPPEVWAPTEEAAALYDATAQPPAPAEEISVAALPIEDEPEAPLFSDAPSPSDPPAPLLSDSEPPEVWAPTEEAAALYDATAQPPAPAEEISVAALPIEDEPEAPLFSDAPSPVEPPVQLPSLGEPPDVWAPTEEAAALYEATAGELYESTARPPAPGDEDALWRTASQAMNEARQRSSSLDPRSLQVLAEATVPSRARSKPPSTTSRDGLIALKPLDDEEEASRRAAAYPMLHEGDEEAEPAEEVEGGFLGLAPPWDARISRWLDVLSDGVALLGRGLDRLTPRDPAGAGKSFMSRVRDGASFSRQRGEATFGRLRGVAPLWAGRSRAWVERLTRRDEPAPSRPFEPAASASAGTVAQAPPRKALKPPPPVSELPVIRLAKIDDDAEAEQAGHDMYQEARSYDFLWLWLKRITLIAGLVAGGVLAASTWEVWLPEATRLGRAFFLEIHEREHPRAPSAEEQRPAPVRELLPALAEQLPHLAPQTIALVMSRSPAAAPDGPEVFARAYDATERGLTALSAPEAQELGALQRALVNTLLPAERQRLREYDLVRARRAPLPTENRDVLRSFAHGARALPSWVRERLQELSGKAIAAGLALPSDASPRAATAP
jgi:hypothetical protein